MVQNVGALFRVFIVLLVFFDFAHNTGQDMFSVEDHHAGFLEISRTCDDNALVDLDLPQIVRVLLQKLFLL